MYKNYYGIDFNNPYGLTEDTTEYYCAEMLLNALALYITTNRPEEEHRSISLFKLLVANSEQRYIDNSPFAVSGKGSLLDALFEELRRKTSFGLELEYYKVFKSFPFKQQLSVIGTLMSANFKIRSQALVEFINKSDDIFIPAHK